MNGRLLFPIVLIACMSAGPATAQTFGPYRIAQSVKTDKGELRILEDARISPSLEKDLWETCVYPAEAFGDDDPRTKAVGSKPLVPARLQQVDAGGNVVTDVMVERQSPIARIDARRLGPASDPVFMIETDNSACAGSYNGIAYRLYDFDHGRLSLVTADNGVGESREVLLLNRLKSAYRIVRNTPNDVELELVRSDPGDKNDKGDDLPFVTTFITYRFNGSAWTWAMRQEPGIWENDGDNFPPRSKFP